MPVWGALRETPASPVDSEGDGDASTLWSPRGKSPSAEPSCFSPKRPQNWLRSCAHTAIMPTNSVIDVNAAASSTKIRNIAASRLSPWNIGRTMFSFCSMVKRRVANCPRTDLQRIASVNKGLCGLRARSEFAPAGGQEQQKQSSLGPVLGCGAGIPPPLHDNLPGAVAAQPLPPGASPPSEQHLKHRKVK